MEFGPLVQTTADATRVAEAQGDEVQTFGNPDQLKLLLKAQGRRWKKSTKAMQELGTSCGKGGCGHLAATAWTLLPT